MHGITSRTYVITWIGLLCLTALSFGSAQFHLPVLLGEVIALGIATVKAGWVLLVFMHMLQSHPGNRLALASAGFMLLLLATLMFADVRSRLSPPVSNAAQPPVSAALPGGEAAGMRAAWRAQ
jgi:caa(3)-type oxidase subunit IV